LFVSTLDAQLTPDQRIFDFQQLVNTFAKQYGPYEWKRDRIGFDLYDTHPWLTRIRAAKDDLEFQEILSEYVASLQDAHSQLILSSNFVASIGLSADLYDGRVLIDGINRQQLPLADYPIQIGDEVISIDGVPALDLARDFARFIGLSEPRSRLRNAIGYLFFRAQGVIPRAHQVGGTAAVVLRRRDGTSGTYNLTWTRTGIAIEQPAPVPSPRLAAADSRSSIATPSLSKC
jgi:hypothetical protein